MSHQGMIPLKNLFSPTIVESFRTLDFHPISQHMSELQRAPFTVMKKSLLSWVQQEQLYALIDPFFELPEGVAPVSLETRDTDPLFFDVIAWDQVTYEPPVLVKLNEEGLNWLLNTLSTERWGVFVASSQPLKALAEHFQKFVIAKGPDENPYFLRFHDASVLEVLLSTWSARDRQIFFGPCEAFGLPNLDTLDVVLAHNPDKRVLRKLPDPEDCLLALGQQQLAACADAIDRDLVKVIYWHLRNYHSKCVQHLHKPMLEHRIVYGISRARKYALNTISDLAGFTALMFELAPNFDEHPSFRRVLQDPVLPPDAKMKRLSQVITDREWDEAFQLYDRGFWVAVMKKAGG